MPAGATLTTAAALLKERYLPRVREQINDKVKLLQRIESSSAGIVSDAIGGKYATWAIHTKRNSGIGSRLEWEALPTPGNQGNVAARSGLHYAYGGAQLSGQAIALTDTDPQAFTSVLTQETDRLSVDLKKDLNRQLYQDGTGLIGVVTSVVTSNTIPVADARLFQINANVDLVTLPNTVVQSARLVTGIDLTPGANTVTVNGAAITTVVGQIFVRNGSGPSASGNREITGLSAIVSKTGILYNVDPSAEPEWTSEVSTNAGTNRSLSEGLMNQLYDRIQARGGDTSLLVTSRGVKRSYANLLMQTRQTVNTTKFTGGYSGLAYTTDEGEIPLIADDDAPLNKIWFLNEKNFTFFQDKDWDWLDRDGDMWEQVVDTNGRYDAYYAYLYRYHELAVDRRNTQGLLGDITES